MGEENTRKLNLIVVFNKSLDKVLFCIRAKEPYKGKYQFKTFVTLKNSS